MFITKKNRIAVYTYLFKEGTMVCKKDVNGDKHFDAVPIPNLEVMKILQSFASKGFVRETFNWQWYYCYLTDEGIAYLRQYLGIPGDIVPATLKQSASATKPRADGRRLEDGGEKAKGTGDFNPRVQGNKEGYRRTGGFGRGNAN